MTRTVRRPSAGIVDDIEREDDRRGYEHDELAALHRLVRHLTADGDRRAARAGRRARRTLGEMAPAADDACPLCGWWRCHCGQNTLARMTTAPATVLR